MIDKHHDEASVVLSTSDRKRLIIPDLHADRKARKIKLVHCCGFDCIPCDLGTQMVVEHALEATSPSWEVLDVTLVALKIAGGLSGGTVASFANVIETSSPAHLRRLSNPFFLNPMSAEAAEPDRPSEDPIRLAAAEDCFHASYEPLSRCWTIPYLFQGSATWRWKPGNLIGSPSSTRRSGHESGQSLQRAAELALRPIIRLQGANACPQSAISGAGRASLPPVREDAVVDTHSPPPTPLAAPSRPGTVSLAASAGPLLDGDMGCLKRPLQ